MPPKPLHPVVSVASFMAALTIVSALCALDYKNHMFIDLLVGFWVLTVYSFDLVAYNFVNIIVSALFLVASLVFETLWYRIYTNVG